MCELMIVEAQVYIAATERIQLDVLNSMVESGHMDMSDGFDRIRERFEAMGWESAAGWPRVGEVLCFKSDGSGFYVERRNA